MQNTTNLNKKQLELLEKAKKHIKKKYKDEVTSIASVLLTKKRNIYTGVNVKYHKIWKCICAERVSMAKAVEAHDTIVFRQHILVLYLVFSHKKSYNIIMTCENLKQGDLRKSS